LRKSPLQRKTPLRKRSLKKIALDRVYFEKRTAFLAGKTCFFPGCWKDATTVSHTKGRGKYYLVVSTWLPSCAEHEQFIHANPAWSYQKGYMKNRN
jgi:hypothetical protein